MFVPRSPRVAACGCQRARQPVTVLPSPPLSSFWFLWSQPSLTRFSKFAMQKTPQSPTHQPHGFEAGTTDLNPFEILKADHRKVSDLLQEMMQNDSDYKVRLDNLNQIFKALVLHNQMEETHFYPELTRRATGLIAHSIDDHRQVERLLQDMSKLPVDSPRFMEMLMQVDRDLRDHIDEEENNVFRQATLVLNQSELHQIAKDMLAMKASGGTAQELMGLKQLHQQQQATDVPGSQQSLRNLGA